MQTFGPRFHLVFAADVTLLLKSMSKEPELEVLTLLLKSMSKEPELEVVNWLCLAQERGQWRLL